MAGAKNTDAKIRNHSHTGRKKATVDTQAGTIDEIAGLPGVVMGAGTIKAGDQLEIGLDVIAEVKKEAATVFADKAAVHWDGTNAVTIGGTHVLGVASGERGGQNGDTYVLVVFNKHIQAP